jgi:hypothetical protein
MTKKLNRMPIPGAVPRADFLPDRIRVLHDGRKNRFRLAVATLLVVLVSASGYFASRSLFLDNQAKVAHSRLITERILSREGRYSDVLAMVQESKQLRSSYTVASQTKVSWGTLLTRISRAIPAGGAIKSVNLAAPSALESSTVTAPLSGRPLLVTATISLSSPTYSGVEYFLLDARQWPGYSNAVIGGVSKKGADYQASLTIYFDANVLDKSTGIASSQAVGGAK